MLHWALTFPAGKVVKCKAPLPQWTLTLGQEPHGARRPQRCARLHLAPPKARTESWRKSKSQDENTLGENAEEAVRGGWRQITRQPASPAWAALSKDESTLAWRLPPGGNQSVHAASPLSILLIMASHLADLLTAC